MDPLKIILALTPDQFQTAAMAWIGAFVVVITGLAIAIAKLSPVIQQVRDLFSRLERQGQRLDSQQKQITQVALNTPAPTSEPQDPPNG